MSYNRKYRVDKVTYENGDVFFLVARSKICWLTGKEVWRYYDGDWYTAGWTRHVSWAEKYLTEEDAREEICRLIRVDHRMVKSIETVKEY